MITQRRKRQQAPEDVIAILPTATFSSDLLTPEEERELLASFWETKTELVKGLIRGFPRLRSHRPPMEPWPMAQFIREHCNDEARDVPGHPPHPRPLRPSEASAGVGQHPPGGPRRQALPPSRPGLCRPAARSGLRPDAGHRPLRRQPRHPPGHLRHLVDSPDAADRRGPPEPPGQPVAAPPARARPAAAGIRSPGPRRQAPAQPARAGLSAPAPAWSTSPTCRPPPARRCR